MLYLQHCSGSFMRGGGKGNSRTVSRNVMAHRIFLGEFQNV